MTKNTMLVIPAGCVLYVEVDLIEDKIVPTSSTFFLNTQDHELKISCDKGPKPVVISWTEHLLGLVNHSALLLLQ